MGKGNSDHFAELRLSMEAEGGELLRAFVREASLVEGVPPMTASLIAADAAQTWQILCGSRTNAERAAVLLSSSKGEARARILLNGHSRFSAVVGSLSAQVRRDAGLSYRERGVDGWEITIHRGFDPSREAAEHNEEPIAEAAETTETVRIDVPQQSDFGGDRALLPGGLWTQLRSPRSLFSASLLAEGRKRRAHSGRDPRCARRGHRPCRARARARRGDRRTRRSGRASVLPGTSSPGAHDRAADGRSHETRARRDLRRAGYDSYIFTAQRRAGRHADMRDPARRGARNLAFEGFACADGRTAPEFSADVPLPGNRRGHARSSRLRRIATS